MPPRNKEEKNKLRIKIQTASGDVTVVDEYPNTKLKDLAYDFFEFKGWRFNEKELTVQLRDPDRPQRGGKLDFTLTLEQLGIKEGDRLLFIFNDDITNENSFVTVKFISDNKLQIGTPFPANLSIDEYLGYSSNILRPIDWIYSVFSLLYAEDKKALVELYKILSLQEKQALHSSILYPTIRKFNGKPMQLANAMYGSPFLIEIDGLWKPLEIVIDFIKDLMRLKHDKIMASHEERVAFLKEEELKLNIIQRKLEIVQTARDINLPEKYEELVVAILLPNVKDLGMVYASSPAVNIIADESKFTQNALDSSNYRARNEIFRHKSDS